MSRRSDVEKRWGSKATGYCRVVSTADRSILYYSDSLRRNQDAPADSSAARATLSPIFAPRPSFYPLLHLALATTSSKYFHRYLGSIHLFGSSTTRSLHLGSSDQRRDLLSADLLLHQLGRLTPLPLRSTTLYLFPPRFRISHHLNSTHRNHSTPTPLLGVPSSARPALSSAHPLSLCPTRHSLFSSSILHLPHTLRRDPLPPLSDRSLRLEASHRLLGRSDQDYKA